MEQPPPFFTWVDEIYFQQADVPVRLREFMQILWLHGTRLEDLARHFHVPVEWVDDFVHGSYPSEKPN
jgi:hypothetical protein